MKDTLGIIINNPMAALDVLTKHRNPITLPFFARYRMVDFALSNFANSGIHKIGIVTSDKYRSLLDHVGIGQEWGLSRKNQSLVYMQGGSQFGHSDIQHINTVDFIKNRIVFDRNKHKNIMICSPNIVANIDYEKYVLAHNDNHADITFLTVPTKPSENYKSKITFKTDNQHTVEDLRIGNKEGFNKSYAGILIINRDSFHKLIALSDQTREYDLFQIIIASKEHLRLTYADITEYYRQIDSIQKYYEVTLELLDFEKAEQVFKKDSLILTKIKDNHPTLFKQGCDINHACIASGGIIYGSITNSVVFRHAHIGEGTKVSNSILMSKITIGKNAVLDYVIADRNVVIGDNVVLKGTKDSPVILEKETVI